MCELLTITDFMAPVEEIQNKEVSSFFSFSFSFSFSYTSHYTPSVWFLTHSFNVTPSLAIYLLL